MLVAASDNEVFARLATFPSAPDRDCSILPPTSFAASARPSISDSAFDASAFTSTSILLSLLMLFIADSALPVSASTLIAIDLSLLTWSMPDSAFSVSASTPINRSSAFSLSILFFASAVSALTAISTSSTSMSDMAFSASFPASFQASDTLSAAFSAIFTVLSDSDLIFCVFFSSTFTTLSDDFSAAFSTFLFA